MYSILEQLRTEISSLESFVSSISPVNDALSTHPDASVRQYLTLRRQYDYAAFVVALYASFERFTETLVAEYARQISSFTQYKDLPEALTKKHLAQSADMLSRKRLGEGRYANLSPVSVAESLFNCLSGAQSYSLTSEAVIAHDTNLRFADVGKLLGDVGISDFCQNLPAVESIWEWFVRVELEREDAETVDRTPEMDGAIKTIFETRLNDLVERRNEVAHRGGNADELLGQAEMLSRIDTIRTLAEAMFEISSSYYLRLRTKDKNYSSRVEIVEGPYKSGSVIIINPPSVPLFRGQPSFVLYANGRVRWGTVLGLMVNDQPTEAINPGEINGSVGVELDIRCNKNSEVWISNAPDLTVWAPIN
ncbi:hypothetical protein D3C78_568730 [compost metagenome]